MSSHITFETSDLRSGEAAVQGRSGLVELRQGLRIHYTDIVELGDFSRDFQLQPGLAISLVLDGDVDASIDGVSISHGQRHDADYRGQCGCLWSLTKPASVHRIARRHARQRKVNIALDRSWLDGVASPDEQWRVITDLADRHLVSCHWTPTARSRRLACDILETSRTKNSLQKLQMESCSIALVAETFYQISSRNVSQNQKHTRSLSRWQQQRVATIRDRLSDDPMNVESLTALARNAGMSVSTLQRYFKELTGTTIISYIRRCRLEQARLVIREQGITIGEAAYLSGYSNPSNFVAAFKRTFGMSPSALIS